jgi:hypothetical protein
MEYFTMKEAPSMIGFPFGRNILYDYLKQLCVIQKNRIPYPEFLIAGYFYYGYGNLNTKSSRRFAKTLVTFEGIKWLRDNRYNEIMELDRQYLEKKHQTKTLE